MKRLVTFSLCTTLLTAVACHSGKGSESPASQAAQIVTKEVTYSSGTTELKGFLAYPATADKRPGVLIAHEWWGLNEYTQSRARKLAELGYVALAIDMYGGGKNTEHPDQAKQFMLAAISDLGEARKRFEAAQALLSGDAHVDATKLAAIGYCFGGATVLHMARFGDNELDLVASFHGNLATQQPMQKGAYTGKIFVAQGGADPFVPPEQVAALKQELDAAGANYELVEYPGVKHGFTNPGATALGQKNSLPLAYDPDADAKSWQRFMELLEAL